MATVVNARDVQLQAYTPRVSSVAMAPNIVVSQDQVTGLGIVVAGTKLVFLEASTHVFQIAKSGTVTPSSTTLTAKVQNLITTPVLSLVAGTMTATPTLTFAGGSWTATFASTAMTTDSVTLRVTVVEASVTYTDDITVVKVREGTDSLNGFLTNESCSISADVAGNPLSYSGAGGTFKVFQGTSDITTLCTFALAPSGNPQALTYSINPSTGVYSVTGGYPVGSALATLTIRATFGTVTLDKVFTIAKLSSGQRGSRTYYVALGGATSTYSDSLATTTVTADGGPILRDIVTQYNNSVNFSMTKFWDGAVWTVVNAVVDGNLLVSGTIGAGKLAADAVVATNIDVANLSSITATIGTLRTATSGARTEISDNVIKVFDSTGALRVQLGDLSL